MSSANASVETYTIVYSVLVCLGVTSSTFSIIVLHRPALRSLQIKWYCQLLMLADLFVYLSHLTGILTVGGCTFYHYWFAVYFAHMGWQLLRVFNALSSYIILWMALDRCLAVWWLKGYNFIKQPQVQKLRVIGTAGFCFVINLPIMVIGSEVKCITGTTNNTLSRESPDCSTGTWLLSDTHLKETWLSQYISFVFGAIFLVPGVLMLAFNLSLVAAVLLGRVRFNRTRTKQQVKAMGSSISREENTGETTLSRTQEEHSSMSTGTGQEQNEVQTKFEQRENDVLVRTRIEGKEMKREAEGEQNSVQAGGRKKETITLEGFDNEEVPRARYRQQVVTTITKEEQHEALEEILVDQQGLPTKNTATNSLELSDTKEEEPKTDDGRQEVLAGTEKRHQTRDSKGWSEAVSRSRERNLVITMITMATSYLIFTTPYVIHIILYAKSQKERCLEGSSHGAHVIYILMFLENLLHIVFLICLIPSFRHEVCRILGQAASCVQIFTIPCSK